MTRFFVTQAQIEDDIVTLGEDDAHHLRVVTHHETGDRIAILDGNGAEWEATLLTLGKKAATAKLGRRFEPATEAGVRVTIAQALPKVGDKMEQVLQRGTEIGAHAFRAFSSAKSLSHLTGERQEKRLARWRTIVKTAAEQAHRAILPDVAAEDTFADIIRSAGSYDLALLAYEHERKHSLKSTLRSLPAVAATILLIVGPESGITDDEAAAAIKAGIKSISLGPRILRTETAAMAATAQILFEWED